MSSPNLLVDPHLRHRVRLLEAVASVPPLAMISIYFWGLMDYTQQEWMQFALAVLTYALLAMLVSENLRRAAYSPLARSLDSDAGAEMDQSQLKEAFRAVMALPRRMMEISVGVWLGSIAGAPLLLWLIGHDGTGVLRRLPLFAVAGGIGGISAGAFVFFGVKRLVSEIRRDLASALRDPEVRSALVPRISLAHKIRVAIMGSVGVALLLALSLVYMKAGAAIDSLALDWQERTLAALDERITRPGVDQTSESGGAAVDDPDPSAGEASGSEGSSSASGEGLNRAVAQIFGRPELLPYPVQFSMLSLRSLERDEADPLMAELSRALARGEVRGRIAGTRLPVVVAWRAISGRGVLVAKIPTAFLRGTLSSSRVMLVMMILVCLAVSAGVAWALAADIRGSACVLSAEAQRMAQGDLRRGRGWESEDELGDLGRALETMGGVLRGTAGGVLEAADQLEEVASGIAGAAQSVAVASTDQVRQIEQANQLMAEITSQVSDVSDAARVLNISIEESGSSILELGAAGEELNDTASILSSKVDDVSGSIEQVVASVKQVGATSAHVSSAADETSASMEEMASSMRAVDSTAERAAGLSGDVVSLAESGQQKVSQTMEGMRAISEATEAADKVIRGLGARAEEIGGILDVIEDVADETNLLALNAAIIAAQAGENGRAFSVVADEIKELADRTLASTKEIGGLIRSVQEESINAVGAIEAGALRVASGVDLSAEAGSALEEITRASRESGTRIAEIVESVRQQAEATSHVVGLMEGVRDGVRQISEAGGEQARGSEVVLRSTVTMQDVAKQVRHTTEEQARGFGRIRDSVESVREAVGCINGSLEEQTGVCSKVSLFLEEVSERTRSNEEETQRMGGLTRNLLAQAEALRESISKVRI